MVPRAVAAYVLTGLRVSRDIGLALFRRVEGMQESTTYQAILDEGHVRGRAEGWAEGRAEEARRMLLRLGRAKLGPADAATVAALEALTDLDRLEALGERLLKVASWQELLAEP